MNMNEWKDSLATLMPIALVGVAFAIALSVASCCDSRVQVERLKLAQMQYQSSFVPLEVRDADE